MSSYSAKVCWALPEALARSQQPLKHESDALAGKENAFTCCMKTQMELTSGERSAFRCVSQHVQGCISNINIFISWKLLQQRGVWSKLHTLLQEEGSCFVPTPQQLPQGQVLAKPCEVLSPGR